ncbi:nitrate reductase [Phormidium sp. FACHB-1136]|uniref:molybdopterin oxidoreductase family protein n=1 Tax=Phormidium sp. FACHB-1136 TaxID=2692848 RepID=UPI00168619B0|nr:nitrate reductase [Phormidium sp. FACHB-1136]MBD2424909.1 nitrate reductase [Phormidium sp. FACHB-1136]
MTAPHKTLCPYCGVGCGLEVVPQSRNPEASPETQRWQTRGDRAHPSSQGMVCVKGATVAESIDQDRLLYPMLRESLDAPFERVSWDVALDAITHRIREVIDTLGPDGVCMYGSGQFQTEDYYVAQKLIKGCLGTNNFDANSRLCMSSAVSGYLQSLGSDGPPCCYADLDLTDCAFLIGTNTAECHPIVFNRLRKHHKRNPHIKLIVVDPRCTETAQVADLHLAIRPGTDITLLNGIGHLLLTWGALDRGFIDQSTQGFQDYREVLRHYAPSIVAERCGIPETDLETAARTWAESQNVLSLWSMGLNQSSEGTAKVCSLINLHLLTGQIGKPGAGPFSLTGQPNAMGGREAGGLAHILPGYRLVKNPQHRQDIEQFWGLPEGRISPTRGLTVGEMIPALEHDQVGLLWIAATNPAVSLPDLNRTKAALQRSPFTVYQDAYYPTETAAYAHLLLPAAQWGEKTGTMTNSERTVTLCQAFRPPVGEARADWEIFAEVGRRLGFAEQFRFATSAEVHREFVQITQGRPCDMTGISHENLATRPIQWPCPSQGNPDTSPDKHNKRLYTDHRFHYPDGRARFMAYHEKGLAEPVDDRYPFVLTTGRLYGHWHTQTRTGRIAKIQKMHPQPFLEMHPRDAERLQLADQDWVEVKSARGMARLPLLVTKNICPGTLFVPMHWGALWAESAECNALTHPSACPISLQPELKACAVQVVPLSSSVQLDTLEKLGEAPPQRAAMVQRDPVESSRP